MHLPNKKVFFADHAFYISENVYEPAEDSFLFAENLDVGEGDVVLDMGTGCGILGIIAAEKASKVSAVDVNPHAVRCAKKNAELGGVSDRLFFIQGDLFTTIRTGEIFDVILFNAPYLPSGDVENRSIDRSWMGRAWSGGPTGREVIDSFIQKSPKYLKQNGHIFLMQSTLSGISETLRKFRDNGLTASVIAERALPFFETVVLVEAEQ